MLFAEMDPDLKGALVGLLVILTLVIQSLYADWRQKKVAAALAVKVDAAAVKVDQATEKAEAAVVTATDHAGKTTKVLGDVYSTLNGDGIGGRLATVEGDVRAIKEELKTIPQRAAIAAVAAMTQRTDGDAQPRAGG